MSARASATWAALATSFVTVVAVGCGGGKAGYPASAERDFLRTCESQLRAENPTAACVCALDEVERTVPYAEYEQAAEALRENRAIERSTGLKLRDAITGCLDAEG